jgi:hypothetical protein
MKVGDGNLGSRFSKISFALLEASFLRQRSTEAAAASSWKRSMIVVAVKSISSQLSCADDRERLTSDRLLFTA